MLKLIGCIEKPKSTKTAFADFELSSSYEWIYLTFSQLSLSLQLSNKARIIRIHRGNYRYFSHSIRKYYIVFAHVVSYQKGNPAY